MQHQNRETGTGQYTFEGGLERLCVCGHSLGNHAAERVKVGDKKFQDCFVDTWSIKSVEGKEDFYSREVYQHLLSGKNCACTLFKPAKKI